MEKYSALDTGIYVTWTLLLLVGAGSAVVNVISAVGDPSYFQFRSVRHILFSSVTGCFLTYLFYALAWRMWKGEPDTELLLMSSKIGNLLSLFSLVTIGMIVFLKMEADQGAYLAILGGSLLGAFGFFTRRRFKNFAKKNPAMR